MDRILPVGKLNLDLLRDLLARCPCSDPRVLVGPGIGEDVAVVELEDRCLVLKTDPITFATDQIGWYAVHVNANDIATSGASPRWFLATLLLPEKLTTEHLVVAIFDQISAACREIGASLVGGHTEITYGLDRPIVVGQMIGEVPKGHLVRSDGAQVGDSLLLTKGLGLEAAALIAREKADELRRLGYDEQHIEALRNVLRDPGISVLRDAQVACQAGRVHAMHDPTEGGVATGLWELALAAKVGVVVEEEELQRLNHYADVFEKFGLDPLGVIGSGALLIAAGEEHAERMLWKLLEAGVQAAIIGNVVHASKGCKIRGGGQPPKGGVLRDLPRYDQDEITKLFA